jgi:hypothetical protein
LRKIISCLLVLLLAIGGIALTPGQAWAGNGKDKGKDKDKDWKVPYGIAKKINNGIFEELLKGNKKITWEEIIRQLRLRRVDCPEYEARTAVKGVVRLTEKIGSNTWVVIANNQGLRSVYFPADKVPYGLKTGVAIEAKVEGQKIVSCNLDVKQNTGTDSLVFSVATSPAQPQAGQAVALIARLINTSASPVVLQNAQYRFTLQKVGSSSQWEFHGNASQDLTIPAQNSSNPLQLAPPTSLWTPPAEGEYRIGRAQLRINNGAWQDIKLRDNDNTVNLLAPNQSNVETDTTGFASFGQDIYVGAALSRTTGEKWQGDSSLRVETNGYNYWQGANINYKGYSLSGQLTFSFYIKAPQGTPLKVKVYDKANESYPTGGTLEFTATGSWERKTVVFTPRRASGDLYLQVYLNNSNQATDFYLDGMQLEKGNQASVWLPGGLTLNTIFVGD